MDPAILERWAEEKGGTESKKPSQIDLLYTTKPALSKDDMTAFMFLQEETATEEDGRHKRCKITSRTYVHQLIHVVFPGVEVREDAHGNFGVFAAKTFEANENLILEEATFTFITREGFDGL